jgi:hypothetical protein
MGIDPKLQAEFVLDRESREPAAETDGDTKHYSIELSVADAPPGANAVTYTLDDSFYDPIREARNRANGFKEEITSYGDFQVRADIRTKNGTITLRKKLSDMLKEHHGSSDSRLLAAIRELKES